MKLTVKNDERGNHVTYNGADYTGCYVGERPGDEVLVKVCANQHRTYLRVVRAGDKIITGGDDKPGVIWSRRL